MWHKTPSLLGIWTLSVATGCAGTAEPASQEWEGLAGKGLVPIERTASEYPGRAALAGVQGCVTASFDVMPDGRTGNYEILDSRPQGVFVKAAVLALRDWRFPEREGPVRTQQTINFQLTNMSTGERPECDTDSEVPEVYRMNSE